MDSGNRESLCFVLRTLTPPIERGVILKKSHIRDEDFLRRLPKQRLLGYLGSLRECSVKSTKNSAEELLKNTPEWHQQLLLVRRIIQDKEEAKKLYKKEMPCKGKM